MGDHRADIKVEFTVHGKTYKQEFSINYFPDEITGIDQRVADWFRSCWEDAYERYSEILAKAHAKEDALRQEKEDRELYEKLKKKFEKKEP